MRRFLFAALIACAALPAAAQAEYWESYGKPVIRFLEAKAYEGDKRAYAEADLAVSAEVEAALDQLGLSRFALLRNEIWARHGYVFKTAILDWIFGKVSWYARDPSFGMGKLAGTAAKNADWIKTLEDNWDYQNIGWWLDGRDYSGDLRPYLSDSDYALPDSVRISANHLAIRPSRLLRNEIFARKGYAFDDPVLKRLFRTCFWYKPYTSDLGAVGARFNATERANVELCRLRENLDNLESVNYSLPAGTTWIPTMDYGAIFVRELEGPDGGTYHCSSTDLWTALAFDPSTIGRQVTKVDELVDAKTRKAIEAERDPLKKLVLYFSSKRYAGYADTTVFNKGDMTVPSYLASAVQELRLDWLVVLRKEIHARNGAVFTDPKTGPIFRACPWYKAKYNLSPSSLTRFPSSVKISKAELANFALLEGEDLCRRRAANDADPPKVVADLSGAWYYIETERVGFGPRSEPVTVPLLYKEGESRPEGRPIITKITEQQGYVLEEFIEEQSVDFFPGC